MSDDRKKLLNLIVQDIFCGIVTDDILRFDNNGFWIGTHQLDRQEVASLQVQATMIRDSYLWKLLVKNIQNLANKKMFDKSQNFDDMYFGKAMLYELDVLDTTLKNLETLKVELPELETNGKQSKKSSKEDFKEGY